MGCDMNIAHGSFRSSMEEQRSRIQSSLPCGSEA